MSDTEYLNQELSMSQERYWAEMQERQYQERVAEVYSDRMALIHATAEQVLDGRIWEQYGRAHAQQALACILEVAAFKVPQQ